MKVQIKKQRLPEKGAINTQIILANLIKAEASVVRGNRTYELRMKNSEL